MNDELPTDERLLRIERGVQRRIDLRRLVVRRIAGGAVAVLLVAGGIALVRPVLGTSVGTSGSAARPAAAASASGSSASGSSGDTSAAGLVVRCHGARPVTALADPAQLPASALAACARAERGASATSAEDEGAATTATPPPSTLCRAPNGALHVYPGGATACAQHGMQPYAG